MHGACIPIIKSATMHLSILNDKKSGLMIRSLFCV